MFFTARVEFFNEVEIKVQTNCSFVCAETFSEAAEQLINYYGEEHLESMTIKAFAPYNVLDFEPIDEELFEKVEETLGERVVW